MVAHSKPVALLPRSPPPTRTQTGRRLQPTHALGQLAVAWVIGQGQGEVSGRVLAVPDHDVKQRIVEPMRACTVALVRSVPCG